MTEIVNGPIENERINVILDEWSLKTRAGAHSIFLGRVRADELSDGSTVLGIEYSCHEALAKETLKDICHQAIEKFTLIDAIILHSKGFVKTGALSLFVLTAAIHRKQTFEALYFMVEEIKQNAPFWKKEIGEAGRKHWVRDQK